MAGAVGMAPALGLAVAAPAAAATPTAHTSGKKVSLEAGQATHTTACTATYSKIARGGGPNLAFSVPYKGSCISFAVGKLEFNESPGSMSGDIMRTRVYNDGARVFSSLHRFSDKSGSVLASQAVHVIGHTVCVAAFSRVHPHKKLTGPFCKTI
jgi:hypothetical protein